MYKVIGHKNPDTDSVCSAIAYAEFLRQQGKEVEPFLLGKPNKETEFVLERFSVATPEIISSLEEGSKVVLVDHNEKGQSIDNLAELDLQGVIDHHKIDLKTEKPISVLIQPWGSTASIVADMYFQEGAQLDKPIAGLLLSAIISDTLFFRSPTTTAVDKELTKRLNEIAGIDNLEAYSLEMFKAKSDLGDMPVDELIKLDYKVFEFKDGKYGIGVMETTDVDYALKRKDEILEGLKGIKEGDDLKAVYFVVVDILNSEAFVLSSDEEAKNLFKGLFSAEEREKGVLFVKGLVSRKKQMIPRFEKM